VGNRKNRWKQWRAIRLAPMKTRERIWINLMAINHQTGERRRKPPPPISMQIYIIRRRPNTTALFFPPQRWMGRTGCKLCVTDEVLLTIKQGLGRRKIRTVVLVTCCTHKPG
jgi:hypothetical protein